MSILPSDAQRSASSLSKTLSQNPSIDNGLFQDPEFVESSIPVFTDTQTLGSVQISDSHSVTSHSDGISGQLAAADFGGSSKKVNELQTPDGKKSSSRRNHTTSSHFHLGQEGLSSQFKYDQVGSSQPRVKSGAVASPHSQSSSGSIIFSGTATHSATRKNQTMNGNHLLNFHYDPISRSQQRITPPRRQQKIKPYNRDLFLQAHYRFVVLDTGNYTLESMDPDKMFQWEDVICVRYSTPFHVHCPICLESPLCPQITSCGHIFCFPCILRYLLMGEEDHKGDCWKKCPLCFVMISLKDLYTIYIEYVNQYRVGDNVQFALLTRPKDCLIPSQKNQQGVDVRPCISNDLSDSFSKFTLTSDVDISVRQVKSELYDWLARAESGLVDDLEKLPYVSAALEQLEQRKNHWSEHGDFSNSPPLGNCASPCSSTKVYGYNSSKEENNVLSSVANADVATSETCGLMRATTSCVGFKDESKWLNSSSVEKLGGEECLVQTADLIECEGQRVLSSSYDESKSLQRHSNVSKDIKEKDSYTFYQAVDGQHLILHPLNMKCLLHYYGGYDFLPSRISGKILQLETVTQSEAMRRRYRFLSHFSLTTTFQLCEIDLGEMFPLDAIYPFMDEIKKREKERKRLAKKEQVEKIKAEAAAMRSVPISGGFGQFSDSNVPFSMDEFEALGSSTISSSSPPAVGERKLFSDVTRLGFAAAHDSPSLNVDESANLTSAESTTAPRNMVIMSFANIASAAKSGESVKAPKTNGLGKKGKKPSRVLLSTATGRRY